MIIFNKLLYKERGYLMKSKKELAQEKLQNWENKLHCPLCQSDVKIIGKQIICKNNHTFDLAKQGYINLFPEHHEENYNQSLFEARYKLMNFGKFYRGLYKKILFILKENNLLNDPQFIIDLGTGEGTHLNFLKEGLDQTNAIGLDIAKEAIQTAAKHYTNSLWLVGDLGNIPLKDNTLNGALTILTPSNYQEVKRVLNDEAWFIKIIPGKNYLKELREIVLPTEQVLHNPILSIEKFKNNFDLICENNYRRIHELNELDRENLLHMTPLMWNATEDEFIKAQKLKYITLDLNILLGKN